MAVEQAAHRVGDRFVFIVAFDEHGVERGDAAASAPGRPARRAAATGEHRRRIAARGGRFAGGQADLALGHGEARDRIHQQQHVAALVAEVFGDGGRGERGLHARERRLVAGGDDDHAARQAFRAEIALEEFVDFAAALADQADHDHVGVGVPAIMPRSTLLPTPEPAKMPSRWPRPQVSIASITWTPVARASRIRGRSTRRRRLAVERHAAEEHRLRPAVDRAAVGVDHAAQQAAAAAERAGRALEPHAVAAADAGGAGEQVDARCAGRGSRSLRRWPASPDSRSMETCAPTGAGKSATVAVMPTVSTTLPTSDVVITSCELVADVGRRNLGRR